MAHVKRYGMEHVLTTHIAEPVLRLFSAVSFYRANPKQPFTEAERLFKQNLMPHLAKAWNTNRFNFMHFPGKDGAQPSHAIVGSIKVLNDMLLLGIRKNPRWAN